MVEMEDFYRTLIENTQELICYHEPNGLYLYVNPSIRKLAGYEPEELIGKNPYDYFHPDDREYIQTSGHKPTLRGNEKTFVEYCYKTKSGNYIWLQTLTTPIFNEQGQISNLLTSSREITNIIRLREELENKEILLEEASQLAEVGAWELDAKTLKPYQSKALFDILEFDQDADLDLEKSFDLFPDQAKCKIQSCVQDAINLGKSWDLILPIKTAKGNSLWIRSIGKPIIKFGMVHKIFGIIQNVSKQVEDQEKLKHVIDGLTSQKNHLEHLNHIVSHNLRSPVKNLVLLVNGLKVPQSDTNSTELIKHIKKVSHSIDSLLEDLVDMVKILQQENIESEIIQMKEIINKTKMILNGQIQHIKPVIKIDLKKWHSISYPKVYMESIVLNLMSNALKYSSMDRKLNIKFKTFEQDGRKGFYIKDNGLGIDLNKNGAKIFHLNQTFHDNINGKGVGLFMTKKQVELMGGEILVESQLGLGTTFKVFLETGD